MERAAPRRKPGPRPLDETHGALSEKERSARYRRSKGVAARPERTDDEKDAARKEQNRIAQAKRREKRRQEEADGAGTSQTRPTAAQDSNRRLRGKTPSTHEHEDPVDPVAPTAQKPAVSAEVPPLNQSRSRSGTPRQRSQPLSVPRSPAGLNQAEPQGIAQRLNVVDSLLILSRVMYYRDDPAKCANQSGHSRWYAGGAEGRAHHSKHHHRCDHRRHC